MADDQVVPWICGNKLGTITAHHIETGTWTYNGPCSDLYLEVINGLTGYTGVTAAVRESGGSWNGLAVSGTGLTSISEYDPPAGFMTNPAYDFSSWTASVQQTYLVTHAYYQTFMTTYSSDTVTHEDGFISTPLTESYYYKIPLPFC